MLRSAWVQPVAKGVPSSWVPGEKRVVALVLSLPVNAQKLSPESEISIITLGPYQAELYSAFGHSAIRVSDPAHNWDAIYNYGVFNTNQEMLPSIMITKTAESVDWRAKNARSAHQARS